MQSVTMTDGPPSAWERPVPLFEAEGNYFFTTLVRTFDVAPDGRSLMVQEEAATDDASTPQDQIILILNWFEELKARVPVP